MEEEFRLFAGFTMYMYCHQTFRPIFTAFGKHILLASRPGPLFNLAPVHYGPVGDIRILLITTMCMLPDLLRMFCHNKDVHMQTFKIPRTIYFSHPFSSFLGLGSVTLGLYEMFTI